jgi:predicted nucleic acid-binding Zn ribbon protein
MYESKQSRNLIRRREKPNSRRAVRLGAVLSELMEERISPRQARFESIDELWCELLPVELRRHCEITDISGGQLTVLVDSPAYASELRWCSPQLLEELQQGCPGARIQKIKLTVG